MQKWIFFFGSMSQFILKKDPQLKYWTTEILCCKTKKFSLKEVLFEFTMIRNFCFYLDWSLFSAWERHTVCLGYGSLKVSIYCRLSELICCIYNNSISIMSVAIKDVKQLVFNIQFKWNKKQPQRGDMEIILSLCNFKVCTIL